MACAIPPAMFKDSGIRNHELFIRENLQYMQLTKRKSVFLDETHINSYKLVRLLHSVNEIDLMLQR